MRGVCLVPWLAYAALEAFIGVYAVAFPLLLAWIQPVSLSFWSFFEPSPTAFGAFQFFLFGALLLPPTLCMGGPRFPFSWAWSQRARTRRVFKLGAFTAPIHWGPCLELF